MTILYQYVCGNEKSLYTQKLEESFLFPSFFLLDIGNLKISVAYSWYGGRCSSPVASAGAERCSVGRE